MSHATDVEFEIHERLLSQDPTAPSELAVLYLDTVRSRLGGLYPVGCDDALITDAAIDAVLSYVENPAKYDPSKLGLLAYLVMAAKGDLLNALDKEERRTARLEPLVLADEDDEGREWSREREELTHRDDYSCLRDTPECEPLLLLAKVIPDLRDREMVELLMNGERRTDAFAEVLGILDHPRSEQERIVKRHKDRLKKRLLRLGVRIRGKHA
jgi:RNA polymerase sigma-70 factor, ECF subfamily